MMMVTTITTTIITIIMTTTIEWSYCVLYVLFVLNENNISLKGRGHL